MASTEAMNIQMNKMMELVVMLVQQYIIYREDAGVCKDERYHGPYCGFAIWVKNECQTNEKEMMVYLEFGGIKVERLGNKRTGLRFPSVVKK